VDATGHHPVVEEDADFWGPGPHSLIAEIHRKDGKGLIPIDGGATRRTRRLRQAVSHRSSHRWAKRRQPRGQPAALEKARPSCRVACNDVESNPIGPEFFRFEIATTRGPPAPFFGSILSTTRIFRAAKDQKTRGS